VPIFTAREMRRRFRLLSTGLAERGIDLALFHTADNVFYTTGVPLLSEWGRPMWSAMRPNGAITIIGAMIERENMERHAWFSDVRAFPDQENVWRASVGAVRDFARSSGPPPARRSGCFDWEARSPRSAPAPSSRLSATGRPNSSSRRRPWPPWTGRSPRSCQRA